ncbi:MAG: glycosyltransferase family 2 protein [Candidatus Omnitrophica bacterium]|nr:glycosyltransferase family 2 protein [Candidatus Omnitrophota bacterium]
MIYILLPVHNRKNVTEKFVNSLLAQTYRRFHLVLIDDGSLDGTDRMVKDKVPSCDVIRGKGDWWWAGALQKGYEWVRDNAIPGEELILIVNDDTEMDSSFLERGAVAMRGKNNYMIHSYNTDRITGEALDSGVHVDWSKLSFRMTDDDRKINCFSTRGVFLSAGDFLKLGGFYPYLLPHCHSDYEFTIRARRSGMRLLLDKELKLYMNEGTAEDEKLLKGRERTGRLNDIFSRKNPANPIEGTAFIILACPWPWKLLNIMRIWHRAFIRKVANGSK